MAPKAAGWNVELSNWSGDGARKAGDAGCNVVVSPISSAAKARLEIELLTKAGWIELESNDAGRTGLKAVEAGWQVAGSE